MDDLLRCRCGEIFERKDALELLDVPPHPVLACPRCQDTEIATFVGCYRCLEQGTWPPNEPEDGADLCAGCIEEEDEEETAAAACRDCGATDKPLHVTRQCPDCADPGQLDRAAAMAGY